MAMYRVKAAGKDGIHVAERAAGGGNAPLTRGTPRDTNVPRRSERTSD
jgi:hypothetical protein